MPREMLHCYKGPREEDARDFELDPDAMLSDVRAILTTAGFLPPDDPSNNIGYRFVEQQTESTNLKDALVGIQAEQYVPLRGVLGSDRLLILTNEYATHKPDLIGIRTPWCVDGLVSVRCVLNYLDPSAVEVNERIRAFEPLMLENAVPTSLEFKANYPHVCVCVSGSVLEFHLKSWGAAGFEYFAGDDRGEPIVSELYQCFGENPDRYGFTSIRRWQSSPATIRLSTTIAPGKKIGFHKMVFKTRRVTSYKQDGRTFSSNTAPPQGTSLQGVGSSDKTYVPGGSIKPGTPIRGRPSHQEFSGPISEVVTDDWTQALGEVVLYIFSFRTHTDAIAAINGYNAPVIHT